MYFFFVTIKRVFFTAFTSKIEIKQNTAALIPGNLAYSMSISGSLTWSNVGSLNYFTIGTFSAPAYQVSLISLTIEWFLNSLQVVGNIGAVVSTAAPTGAVVNNIAGGGLYTGTQQDLTALATGTPLEIRPLCGVFNNTTSSPITLYVNAQIFQSYTVAPLIKYTGSITKLG